MTYGSQAAAATHVFEQQRDLALRDRNEQHLAAIDAALARLDAGTYGTCSRAASPSRPSASRRCRRPRCASTASAGASPMSDAGPDVAPRTNRDDEPSAEPARRPLVGHRRDPRRGGGADRHRRRTPLVPFGAPDRNQWLKAESLQPIGAFKIRGAYHAAASLSPEARARGLITYSSGNHAQGVARAARLLGVPAAIVMPSDAPADQAGARRGRRRRRSSWSAPRPTSGGGWPRSSPGRAGSRSSRPTTTRGSSPARARSGLEIAEDLPGRRRGARPDRRRRAGQRGRRRDPGPRAGRPPDRRRARARRGRPRVAADRPRS